MVLAHPSSRHRLVGGEASSSSAGGALDCHRNQQNWLVQFAKPEGLFFLFRPRAFDSLFDSCVNTFWRLYWGIDYSKQFKHEERRLRHERIRPRKGQHRQAYLQHFDRGRPQTLEAYHAEVNELFYLHYKVTRQGLILKDAASIIICKAEVTFEV
jgi:hypothetical protein